MKFVLNDILVIWAVLKISATQPTNTQAGYTKDSETCKIYNEKLQTMWATLSKYINSTDSVDEQALHNIAIIIQAYFDHQNQHKQEVVFQAVDTMIVDQRDDNITRVLRNIKKLLGTDNAITKIKEMILVNFKPTYEEQDPECKQINENNLSSSIALSYKNYLENAKCRNNDSPELFGVKTRLRNGQQTNSVRHLNDFYDYVDGDIIGETEQFHEDMIPIVINFKSLGRFNQFPNTRRRLQRVLKGLNERSSQSMSGDSSKTAVYTESRNKINERSEESCIKYANHKFFKTLRSIIERYNNLRDCVHDDTLRTLNKITKTPRDFRYTEPRISDNNIQLMASIRPGQLKQIRINNFGNNLKEFKRQKAPKTLFVVRRPSYASQLLSQLRNRFGNISPPLPYYSSQNNNQQMKYPFDYILRSEYKFDNKHKSFLGSPDANLQMTNKILNTQCAMCSNEINNGNNIKRNKNIQVNTKPSLDTQEQNSRSGEILEMNTKGSELLDTNKVISKDLMQDTDTINRDPSELQNLSLQNTQVDVNSNNDDKGYVELSYLVKYPKSTIYHLQYFVKNNISYDDFIKVASHVYVNDENKQLVKVQRFLSDNSTQVLFENREFKSPLAIHDNIDKENKGRYIKRVRDNIKAENQEHSFAKLVANNTTRNVIEFMDDHVNSLKEDKMVSVNPVSLQEYNMQTDNDDVKDIFVYPNVRDEIQSEINHAENFIDFKINYMDSLQEHEVKPNIMEIVSIRKDQSKTDLDPLRQDKKVETYVDKEDSIQKDFINSDTTHGESLRDVQITTSKYSTDTIEGNKMQIDGSSPNNKNKSKNTAAALLADSHRTYKNGNDLYGTDPLIDNKNKAVVHDVYSRTEDESVTTQTRSRIKIEWIYPKSIISNDVNNMRYLQKRFDTNFNSDQSAATNEYNDQVDIQKVSIRYDKNITKATFDTSYLDQKLRSSKSESVALTSGIKFDKRKDKFSSTFQVKETNNK